MEKKNITAVVVVTFGVTCGAIALASGDSAEAQYKGFLKVANALSQAAVSGVSTSTMPVVLAYTR